MLNLLLDFDLKEIMFTHMLHMFFLFFLTQQNESKSLNIKTTLTYMPCDFYWDQLMPRIQQIIFEISMVIYPTTVVTVNTLDLLIPLPQQKMH